MGFGKQLGIVLEEICLTVTDLSKKTGIPASTIYSMIERDTDSVGIDKVKKIEKALRAIPGSSLYNLLYGIKPEEENVTTRQHDWSLIDEEVREEFLCEKYESLNTKGQVKAITYVEDLLKIPEYRKSDAETQEVNAAHDNGATEEQKANADKIMKDDSEWE